MSDQVLTPDDRANAMAINSGLAESSKWEAIYNNVLTKYTNSSCFFDRWVFEALCKIGKEDYALLRMSDRYKTMISASFTTLWEHYDRWWASGKNAFDENSSLNHGWNPPVIILSGIIAGISPEEPGWSVYHVFPKEAFLNSIKAVVPTVKGDIKMEMHKTAASYTLSLVSPKNTIATVGIPKKSFSSLKTIKVNGAIIWEGSYSGGVEGISWIGEDADYIKFNVTPGDWSFVGSGSLPINSPKKLSVIPAPSEVLDKKMWSATASVKDCSFLFTDKKIPVDISAANAIDGDHWTGWRDMTKKQYPGQWFMLDMGRKQKFDKIILDCTWAQWDYPNKYSVSVSDDAKNWGMPITSGSGEAGITTINFPTQNARYIKITQTGRDKTYNWSVYEIDVFRKK